VLLVPLAFAVIAFRPCTTFFEMAHSYVQAAWAAINQSLQPQQPAAAAWAAHAAAARGGPGGRDGKRVSQCCLLSLAAAGRKAGLIEDPPNTEAFFQTGTPLLAAAPPCCRSTKPRALAG
jgi:hypothetical protein